MTRVHWMAASETFTVCLDDPGEAGGASKETKMLSPVGATVEAGVVPSPTLAAPRRPAEGSASEILFGPFRLRPKEFLLLEGDKPVTVGSRALEILVVLLERPAELVSKQELMGRVWPGVFVEPANLTVHISALRRTLRDGRDGNRFIINIPGRGYKFVGGVRVSGT